MDKMRIGVPLTIIFAMIIVLALLGHLFSGGPSQPRTNVSPATAIRPPSGAQGLPQTYLFYLFDASRSMNTGAAESPLHRAIPLLARVIQEMSGEDGPPTPQLHRVGTIGDASLNQSELCEINQPRRMVFGTTDTSATVDSIRACTARLRDLRPTEYTDISGGLKYASLALQGNGDAVRGIFMFTDLEEDLPPRQEPATADLSGICVVVYYEITGNEPTHPSDLDRRIAWWRTRLQQWHARGSLFRLASAFSAADLTHYFADCGRHT